VEKAEPKCECGAMGKFWHCMQGEVAAAGATFTSGKSAKLCASLDHLEKRHVRGKFGWKSSSVRARGISANSSSTLPALGSSQPLDAFTFSLHPHSTIPPPTTSSPPQLLSLPSLHYLRIPVQLNSA
jgi:hypothetical protein